MTDWQRGITLVETLVALAILGLVAASILALIGQNTRFAASARDRAFAEITADNLMVETLARDDIENGEERGESVLANRRYEWRRTITATAAPGLERIDISVSLNGSEQVIASISTLRAAQ